MPAIKRIGRIFPESDSRFHGQQEAAFRDVDLGFTSNPLTSVHLRFVYEDYPLVILYDTYLHRAEEVARFIEAPKYRANFCADLRYFSGLEVWNLLGDVAELGKVIDTFFPNAMVPLESISDYSVADDYQLLQEEGPACIRIPAYDEE